MQKSSVCKFSSEFTTFYLYLDNHQIEEEKKH